jgi:hypothetical protein
MPPSILALASSSVASTLHLFFEIIVWLFWTRYCFFLNVVGRQYYWYWCWYFHAVVIVIVILAIVNKMVEQRGGSRG